jgi:hypothetical protein
MHTIRAPVNVIGTVAAFVTSAVLDSVPALTIPGWASEEILAEALFTLTTYFDGGGDYTRADAGLFTHL